MTPAPLHCQASMKFKRRKPLDFGTCRCGFPCGFYAVLLGGYEVAAVVISSFTDPYVLNQPSAFTTCLHFFYPQGWCREFVHLNFQQFVLILIDSFELPLKLAAVASKARPCFGAGNLNSGWRLAVPCPQQLCRHNSPAPPQPIMCFQFTSPDHLQNICPVQPCVASVVL